jgi:class 3 adenylate cyclase/tetratricopeptide (TPR) repeat protein
VNAPDTQSTAHRLFEATANAENLNRVLSLGAEACEKLGKEAIDLGHLSLAYDILIAGLERYPGHTRIAYLGSLALARSGSLDEASAILAPVLNSAKSTELVELFSLAGRIAKDRWSQAISSKESQVAGKESVRCYLRAFELSRSYFPGINAATMMCLTGEKESGRNLAEQIKGICIAQDSKNHWCLATLGEASLLTGDIEKALCWYHKASKLAARRFGDLASMRRQLRMICNRLELPEEIITSVSIPSVAAFLQIPVTSGNVSVPRFDSEIAKSMAAEISRRLSFHEIGFAYSSASCIEEIQFIDAMQCMERETSILLPFSQKEFVGSYLKSHGEDWSARAQKVMDKADQLEVATSEGHFGDSSLFGYVARLIGGYALLRAEHLETDLVLFTVSGPGAMEDDITIAKLKEQAQYVEVIDLLSTVEATPLSIKSAGKPGLEPGHGSFDSPDATREVRTMIFADVVGFSDFTEESIKTYIDFLDEIAGNIHNNSRRPLFQNTWGDGLFLVFEHAAEAAHFSLELLEKIKANDWSSKGFPEKTNIRIGMHTGPVFPAEDKIICQKNYFGTHVNRAARIEPVATPGTIYLTEQCAAYIVAEDRPSFSLDYIGVRPLAKSFGSCRLYRLRRRSALENINH